MVGSFKHYFAMALLLVAVTSVARAGEVTPLPPGTELHVRMIERLSSETASVGDQFHGTLVVPVVLEGRTLFSKGADVTGEVEPALPAVVVGLEGTLERDLVLRHLAALHNWNVVPLSSSA